ncbi:hypothetical protein ABIB25_004097 [Nakamurella sp. UYEF19]|uniref:protease pro-enzyme activation domain-containing protein n=1 Tax=Nakamurella sp. UYEF19 TaxID=1756392 RepID=UPI0033935D27
MQSSKLSRGMGVATAVVLMAAAGMVGANTASADPASPSITPTAVGAAPSVPSTAKTVGVLPATTSIDATVTLKPADAGALESYATGVSTPGNALYRHYLSAAEFAEKFGAPSSTIAAIRSALLADGLNPDEVSANHLSIQIHGATSTFASAFGTSFKQYRLATGRVAYANTSAPKLAASVASGVQGIIGLDNLVLDHPQMLNKVKRSASAPMAPSPHVVTGGPQPCAAAVTAGPLNAAYTADQLAVAYQLPGLYASGSFGAGQVIAMYELEPNLVSDIAAYQSCYGTAAPISYVTVGAGSGTGAGVGEASLDIENAISVAPKASQLVYQGRNGGSGPYDTYNAIISQNRATIISTSWGGCEADRDAAYLGAENTLFQEAAIQGQSLFDAAGDLGSQDCGDNRLSADDPGGQPFVTVVGGTKLTNPTATTPTEIIWNERAKSEGAGGAGISKFFKMPAYQSGAAAALHVINANSKGTTCAAPAGSYCRQEPDVSLVADPETGYLVYQNGSWAGAGGTSGGAPWWAAFTALTNSSPTCAGINVGFVNPTLYSVAGAAYSANFTDITSGNTDYTGTAGGLYPTAVGYDIASGLGTPKGTRLASSICGGAASVPSPVTGAYQALSPARILNTKIGLGGQTIPANSSITLAVAGRGGVAPVSGLLGQPGTGPSAVAINFTATNSVADGYLTVYPTGSAKPVTSNLNFTAGHDVANTTIAKLGTGGDVTIFNGGTRSVDVIADVAGYYVVGANPVAPLTPGAYQPLANQARLLDTRTLGAAGKLTGQQARVVKVANVAGVPANAASVVLTVTSTNATGNGHLRVFPNGSAIPFASNVNFSKGRTVGNEVIVAPGANGNVTIYDGGPSGTTDLLVDVVGYIAGGTVPASTPGLQKTVAPKRIFDTRSKTGTTTAGKLAAGGIRVIKIVGVAGVPSTARAAIITVTATNESKTGFATVYPGRNRPAASILNFLVNTDVANVMITPIGTNGTIMVYNGSAGPTDLVVDISGYITGPSVG